MSILNTAEAEKEYGIQANSQTSFFKFAEGDNKFRLLSKPEVIPQHYSKGGYMGVCIGKDFNCPGCIRDDEIKKLKEQDKEGNKNLYPTRNVKWLCWIVDHKAVEAGEAEQVKLAMLPHKVAKQLETIVADPEYNVTETPLPFDLILNAKNAGTTKVEYALRAARNNTLIDAEHLEFWKKQNTPAEIIEKMKDKKKKELGLSPTTESTDDWDEPNEEIDVDDIAI